MAAKIEITESAAITGRHLRRISAERLAGKQERAGTARFRTIPAPVGGPCGDRTHDPRIKSPMLYQLS